MKLINQLSMLMVCGFCVVTCDILVYVQRTHRQIEVEFRDMSSTFGASIPPQGIRAYVVYADPPNGCSTLAPPPSIANFTGYWAVLMRRYDCKFEKKVREAQAANYDIAIVHNVNSSELERMQASDPEGITIPSIFVGSSTGLFIKENYQYDNGFYIVIDDESPFDIGTHLLLPFAIVVAVCFTVMIGFMIVKCIKDHRRARRHRLPNSSLKKIPIHKFKKGDSYETCAICIEDFVEGEKLRILPCSHAYHSKCIDPWLTRNKRVCPMCKRRVFAEDERASSDSESASDYDDNTPLLPNNRSTNEGGGTFAINEMEQLRRMLRRMSIMSEQLYGSTEGTAQDAGPSQSAANEPVSDDTISFLSDTSSSSSNYQLSPGQQPVQTTATVDIDAEPSYAPNFLIPPPAGAHSIQAVMETEGEAAHHSLTEEC